MNKIKINTPRFNLQDEIMDYYLGMPPSEETDRIKRKKKTRKVKRR